MKVNGTAVSGLLKFIPTDTVSNSPPTGLVVPVVILFALEDRWQRGKSLSSIRRALKKDLVR